MSETTSRLSAAEFEAAAGGIVVSHCGYIRSRQRVRHANATWTLLATDGTA